MLSVVATPIGNLADISPRALDTLRQADEILCEDTRRTLALLNHFGISKPLRRLDEHATEAQLASAVRDLSTGKKLAVVTDAGTPGISDPAAKLVALAHENGVRVTPVPGPSALTALVSASGLSAPELRFRGFFPRGSATSKGVQEELAEAGRTHAVVAWFESPHRVLEALQILAEKFPRARGLAAKELTKVFERFFVGELTSVASLVQQEIEREGAVGEWCIALENQPPERVSTEAFSSDWKAMVDYCRELGAPAAEVAKKAGQIFGIPRSDAYAYASAQKGSQKSSQKIMSKSEKKSKKTSGGA
ncbi:MAG: 16S rRNA (cytidine(1402)-2'-O)-methyltransferase [Bacteriovoracia bacterium]